MHGFANILMDDVYYSSLQHEENGVFVYCPPDNNYPIICLGNILRSSTQPSTVPSVGR